MTNNNNDELARQTLTPKATFLAHQTEQEQQQADPPVIEETAEIPFAIAEPMPSSVSPVVVSVQGTIFSQSSPDQPRNPALYGSSCSSDDPWASNDSPFSHPTSSTFSWLVPSTQRGRCYCRVGLLVTLLLSVTIIVVVPSLLFYDNSESPVPPTIITVGEDGSVVINTTQPATILTTSPTPAPAAKLRVSASPTVASVDNESPIYQSFTSTAELYDAVDSYLLDPNNATLATVYGPTIGSWDVSRIQNFSRLFDAFGPNARNPLAVSFNDDISQWETSSATDFSFMFQGCKAFNQDISRWQTHNVVTAK